MVGLRRRPRRPAWRVAAEVRRSDRRPISAPFSAPSGLLIAAALAAAASAGCKGDKCSGQPTAFELDVTADPTISASAKRLVVIAALDGRRVCRTFDLSDKLADGKTSLAVDVSPPTSRTATVTLEAWAFDAQGNPVANSAAQFSELPNACNHFILRLEKASGAASGLPESCRVAAPPDGAVPDGAVEPDGAADASTGADAGPTPDTGTPSDTGQPDTGEPDTGQPDAGAVDAGPDSGVAFNYAPSNAPQSLPAPGAPVVLSCNATLNTSTPAFGANWCNQPAPAMQILQPSGAPEVLLLSLGDFTVGNGATLTISGTRAVLFVVFGTASVQGTILASAQLASPGPGAQSDATCIGQPGPANGGGGGGGGGGAGFGQAGQSGGPGSGGNGGSGGGADGTNTLIPLRGGCPGGTGASGDFAGGVGGAGGGAIQISAALGLRVTGAIYSGGGGGTGAGRRTGGGGGGSGGGILLEGQAITLSAAVLAANGGGGGGGGADNNGAGSAGGNGGNGGLAGGTAGLGGGGSGGSGTALPTTGQLHLGGGGGGGGGGGYGRIRLNSNGSCSSTGSTLSPAPSSNVACP